MEVSEKVRVKIEPISDSQSNSQTRGVKRQSIKVKEEPIDIEMQKAKEIMVKVEEKFSATEEFANKISIAFLNEEITQATKQPATNIQKSK